MDIRILVYIGNKIYQPEIEEGVTWSTERKGIPGKLTFKMMKDKKINVIEGNKVTFWVNGSNVFLGFVFSKSSNKGDFITITAYDQIRYLKNKDVYSYVNKTASELLKIIARDYNLHLGKIENTVYKIKSRVEDNIELIDMIENALDLTLTDTGEMFILYDDFGKISLRNVSSLILNLLVDESTGENYKYKTGIDSNTYNQIKLTRENESTGKRDVFLAKNSKKINEWGILQYCGTFKKEESAKEKAESLLKLYENKTRNLSLNNVIGNIKVRGGTMIAVKLDLLDAEIKNMMLVEKAKHEFNGNEHRMNLTLRGGEFIA